MSVDVKQPRSRRALLAGLAGGVAAIGAAALGRPQAARAGVDGDVVLGAPNSAATATTISATSDPSALVLFAQGTSPTLQAGSSSNTAIQSSASGSGTAVAASSDSGLGLSATSSSGHAVSALSGSADAAIVGLVDNVNGTGIAGFAGYNQAPGINAHAGVYGENASDSGIGVSGLGANTITSNSTGVLGVGDWGIVGSGTVGALGASSADGIGVYGSASALSVVPTPYVGAGVTGQSDSGSAVMGVTGTTMVPPVPDTAVYGRGQTGGAAGYGVYGYSPAGTGVFARSSTGYGLRVLGKASFDRSGKLTVLAGHSSVTKTGIALTSASLVLATLQTNRAGVTVQAAVTNVGGSSFTIYLNKAVTANTVVSFMVVG